jgi:hypothetical protein
VGKAAAATSTLDDGTGGLALKKSVQTIAATAKRRTATTKAQEVKAEPLSPVVEWFERRAALRTPEILGNDRDFFVPVREFATEVIGASSGF